MDIEFYTDDESIVEFFPPKSANKVVPEWYKEMSMRRVNRIKNIDVPTIKHCMPVQDMITSGYIIFNTYEVNLYPNEHDGYQDFKGECPHMPYVGGHHHEQFPMILDDKARHYFKIAQPWMVKTPPGYSSLFVQPFYHLEERYQLLPAIVDTDKHDMLVELPGYIKSKTPVSIESGAPLVQVIPFKREDWTMKAYHRPKHRSKLEFLLEAAHRRLFHQKKSFK